MVDLLVAVIIKHLALLVVVIINHLMILVAAIINHLMLLVAVIINHLMLMVIVIINHLMLLVTVIINHLMLLVVKTNRNCSWYNPLITLLNALSILNILQWWLRTQPYPEPVIPGMSECPSMPYGPPNTSYQTGLLELVVFPPCVTILWQGVLQTHVTIDPCAISHKFKGLVVAATVSLWADVDCNGSPSLKIKLLLCTMGFSWVPMTFSHQSNLETGDDLLCSLNLWTVINLKEISALWN